MPQRVRLMLLLLCGTLPVVLLALVFLREGYRETRAGIEDEQLARARAGALATETFLRDNVRTLSSLAVELAGADADPAAQTRQRLAALTEVNPHWNGMSIVAPDGVVIVGGQEASAGQDLSTRPYLQEFFETQAPVVGDGVITTVTQLPSVVIAVPIALADGQTGALLAAITLSDLAEELRALIATNPESTLSLVDRAGQRLVHRTPHGTETLTYIGDRPEVVAALEGGAGTLQGERDGQDRLVAYSPAEDFGWAVVVAQPASVALAPALTLLWQGIATIGVALAIILGIGWLVGGRLSRSYEDIARARSQAEDALRRAGAAELHRMQLLEAEQEARERAEEALRGRDEFLSIASHELRNPVAAIKGLSQLMERRIAGNGLDEADLREYVRTLRTSSDYLARLVDDLLNVSRLQGGRFDLRLEPTGLTEVVHGAIEDVPLADRHVRVEGTAEGATVEVDVDRVKQILVNLLENAAKYSPPGSPIIARVRRSGDIASVDVIDTGIGLPPGEAGNLFAPFARASNAVSANIPGLGLGLYISRRLAEAHGGSLHVVSPGAGQGCTFTLSLPCAPRVADNEDRREVTSAGRTSNGAAAAAARATETAP